MNNSLWAFLSSPVTGTLLGLFGTVASTILAIYLYYRAVPTSRLDYAMSDAVILSKQYSVMRDDLEIRYKGRSIPQASTTMAAFWNNGNQTMHGDQIVKADPLRIRVAEGCEILQAYVVATTRDIIDAQVSIAGWSSAIDVSFDFLERGDGFVIFLAHTGGAGDASVQGTIKGVRQGPRNIKTGWNGVTGVLAVFFLTLVFVLLSRYFVSQISDSEIASYTAGGMTITLAIVILAAAQFVSRLRFRSFPRAFRRDPRLAMLLPHLAEVNSGNNVLN